MNQMVEQANFNDMVELRRHLHMYPELSFKEVNTPKLIAEKLKSFGIEVKENVGGNGVIGYLKGAFDGPTIALRADFDALPIQDEKDVSFTSLFANITVNKSILLTSLGSLNKPLEIHLIDNYT